VVGLLTVLWPLSPALATMTGQHYAVLALSVVMWQAVEMAGGMGQWAIGRAIIGQAGGGDQWW
jgi:hypothetical protein